MGELDTDLGHAADRYEEGWNAAVDAVLAEVRKHREVVKEAQNPLVDQGVAHLVLTHVIEVVAKLRKPG